jgi:hypothetical protein
MQRMTRYVSLLGVAAATLAVAVVVTGCGDSRSILYAGVSPRLPPVSSHRVSHPHVVTDAEAVRVVRSVRASWLSSLASGSLGTTGNLFSPRGFRLRVASAAGRYGFTVERVRFVRTRGSTGNHVAAPLVIVETRSYLAFARATPAILNSLAPHPGLYLEATDELGVPFLVVDEFPGGSGVFARSDPLLQPLGA